MKKEYVIALGVNRKDSGFRFTQNKIYEVLGWFGKSAEVRDDSGKQCFVAVGVPSLRLDSGTFQKINLDDVKVGDHEAYMEAMKSGEGWIISKEGGLEIKSDKYIQNALIGNGMISGNLTVTKDAAITVNGKRYTEREIKNLEKYAEMHKRDCIAAERVIDHLYEVFTEARNPDQLVALAKQAKIFSDAFIELQKII